MEQIVKQLKKMFGERGIENCPLAGYTTFGTGGPARFLAFPETAGEVRHVLETAQHHRVPLLALGGGSNLLVSDRGFPGIVLVTHRLNELKVNGSTMHAQCGLSLRTLLKAMLQHKLGGLEFVAGIPGTVGGAVMMNAGLKDEWFSRCIVTVDVITGGKPRTLTRGEIPFDYRTSGLEGSFISSVTLSLPPADPRGVRDAIARHVARRKETQPAGQPTAGSIFKNPPGAFAGELIERCGLKEYKIGEARISRQHANFIIAGADASSDDIYRLMRYAQEQVQKECGLVLEPEINLVGEFEI